MIRQHDDSMAELAALDALGALEVDEATLIREHMATCDACRAEYRRASRATAALAMSAAEAPPPALRARVWDAVSKMPRAGKVIPLWRRPATLVAVVAAIVIAVVGINQLRHGPAPERTWAGACTPATECTGARVVALAGDRLRLEASGLKQLPKGKAYQAWIIPPKAKAPLPEPTFAVDASGSGSVEMSGTAMHGTVVAVTVEPEGGSQSPTTKPFLIVTLN